MKTLVLAAVLALAPARVFAQAGGGPPSNVRMRLGPVFLNPSLALSNAGRDTNVFNEATNAKEDFTVTVTPATDLWLRVGPSWLQTTIREDLVWYQTFASERSANTSYIAKWLVPLNRITFTPAWSYLHTRERPGFEIDTRAERTETGYALALEYKLFTKTFIGATGRRDKTDFAEGEMYRGTDLHDELNRTGTTATVDLRHQLTPLTSVDVGVSIGEDQFELDPLRNTESRAIAGSIKFDPAALLKGGVSVGYRDFKPKSPDVPGYTGSTLAADLSYVLLGVTKFSGTATRDVQYSYDINQPYYLQTGVSVSINQQIFGPLDVAARGGRRRLDYTDRIGAAVAVTNRTDHQTTYGVGLGYHFGQDIRLGFDVDHAQRESPIALQQYQGWAYGMSVTYGPGS
jgi:Putative beta-barrel porin 2